MASDATGDAVCSSVRQACECGSVDELKKLIAAGHDIDSKDNLGWRPTHVAADNGHCRCLQLLLDQPEVDPDWTSFEDVTALLLASAKGYIDCMEILLQRNANPNLCNNLHESPLIKATEGGHYDCVELLLRHGADPDKCQFNGASPLHIAVYRNNIEVVRLFLDHGADVGLMEDCHITPVFIASQFGRLDCLRAIIDAAKERNQSYQVNVCAIGNVSPLYLAAQNGYLECASLLLASGADPNKLTDSPKAVALYAAIQFGHIECVKLLLPKTDSKVLKQCDASPYEMAATFGTRNASCLKYIVDNISGYPIDTVLPIWASDLDYYYALLPGLDMRKMFPAGATSLAMNIVNSCDPAMIKVMLEGGASPDSMPYMLPPILADCKNDRAEVLQALVEHGVNPNIYHPNTEYNLAVVFAMLYTRKLEILLRYGAETTSLFHADANQIVVGDNSICTCQKFSDVLFELTRSIGVLHTINVAALLELLLEFTTSPGCDPVVIAATPPPMRDKITNLLMRPSSLMHSCRVLIRSQLTYRHLKRSVLTSLNLPMILVDYLLFEGDADSVTDLVNAVGVL